MNLAIFGYGGHAIEVAAQINKKVTFFVDDEYVNDIAKPISKFNPKKYEMMVAVSDSIERKNIVKRLPDNTKYFTFIHPTALIMQNDVEIGEGSFIGAYSILTTKIKIGKHAILNRGNHIGHNSVIDDYFSAMPGAIVSGNVIIEKCVYMGTNSSIKEKTKICENVKIGLNTGIVKDITMSGTYIGMKFKKL